MKAIDFNKPINVHFIGIGGVSMNGLARILRSKGFKISGSDRDITPVTQELEADGIKVFHPQKAENIPEDTDLVIYTAAVHEDNPEYMEAVRRNIPMKTRAQLLGAIMANYKKKIAISGTHGKTTTTGLISETLLDAGKEPGITIGGTLRSIGGYVNVGKADYFVAEACEYTNSFLNMYPDIAIILNVDEDHLDFFKDLADIRRSFKKFANLVPEDGAVIVDSDMEDPEYFKANNGAKFITFGRNPEKSTYSAKDITYNDDGFPTFTLLKEGKPVTSISLNIPGEHNVYNSLAAIAAAYEAGLSTEEIEEGIKAYRGTGRRFEYRGTINGAKVFDDFAHHPDEIKATVAAAKKKKYNKLWLIHQPHTYTRTKTLLDDFAHVFAECGADHVIIHKIFAAREDDIYGIKSEDLVEKINEYGGNAICLNTFEEIVDLVKKEAQEGDIIITMGGSGNVYVVCDMLTGTKSLSR